MTTRKNAINKNTLHLSDDLGPQTSGHKVDFNSYTEKNGKKIPWITKYNKHEGSAGVEASVLEVGFSQVAELCIKPGLTPAARLVTDDTNAVIGVASEKFDSQIDTLRGNGEKCYSFDSKTWSYEEITDSSSPKQRAYTFLDKPDENFFAELLQKHNAGEIAINMESLASILTASYFLEEDDLHKGNIGFYVTEKEGKKNFTFYKIDHDLMFTDSIMSQKDMRLANITYNKNSFFISASDLQTFPDLYHSGNHYWPTKHKYMVKGDKAYSGSEERKAFSQLAENEEFKNAKWKYFLKYTLMPDELLDQTLLMHLDSTKDTDKINLIRNSFHSRTASLKQQLLKCPEFGEYLKTDNAKIALAEIQAEFSQYADANQLTAERINEQTTSSFNTFKEVANDASKSWVAKVIALDAYKFSTRRATQEDLNSVISRFNEYLTDVENSKNSMMAYKYARIAIDMAQRSTLTMDPLVEKDIKGYAKAYLIPEPIDSLEKFKHAADKIRGVDMPLKQQKQEILFVLKNSNLNKTDLEALKKDLSNKEPTSPSLKFINQLRSDLWLVRKIRGTYGKTSTNKEMLEFIDNKVSELNRSTFQGYKNQLNQLIEISVQSPLSQAFNEEPKTVSMGR